MTSLTPDIAPAPTRRFGQSRDDIKFLKLVVLINGLVPAALLIWDAWHQHLGANSVNFAIHTTGMLTLIFITLTLAVTPLRKITGFNWLFNVRRMLGLYAFFYSLSHFTLFFALDRDFSVSSTLSEMVNRYYLIVGSAAILFMIPLALTSTNYMIKRLGSPNWHLLHRLTYLTAILAVLHYYMQVKADVRIPLVFAGIVTLLLGYRIVAFLLNTARVKSKPASVESPVDTTPDPEAPFTGQLRVTKIIQETPNVRTFQLAPVSGPFPFEYLPGQHLSLTLPINGKNVYRSYTIASTPSRPGHCELTIKREDQGTASRHMHSLSEGDTLQISAPAGTFTFNGENASAVLLLAAGVGITPLMAIIRYLTDHRWPGQIHLIYSNKTESDIIFRSELDTLAQQNKNLHITHTLTRESTPSWTGRHGRIDAPLLQLVPNLTTTPIYICGPTDMLTATRTLLHSVNVPDANIHFESFGTRRSATAIPMDAATFTLTFARSQKTAPCPSSQPLLEVAEDNKIYWDYECRSGICGRCKCKLLAGSVTMETQDALTPQDKRDKLILLCQAKATEDVSIDA